VLAIAAVGVGACGESDQEKAQNQVCDARADIKKQVDELTSLTLSTATVDGVKQNLNAIKDDLQKMKDAEGNLDGQRKLEVESATQVFGSKVQSILSDVGSGTSLSAAASQLRSALEQLGKSYQQALAPLDC
jgi:hypothetical protein